MKHKLTSESKVNAWGKTLFRIEAGFDCKWAKKGEIGGWVEKLENVSGNAWVSGDAEVSGNAEVYGDAWVYGNARVYGELKLSIGYYFGFLFKGDALKEIKNYDGTTLLYKE